MTGRKLFDALRDIDPRYIAAAAPTERSEKPKSVLFASIAKIAASVVVVVTLGFLVYGLIKRPTEPVPPITSETSDDGSFSEPASEELSVSEESSVPEESSIPEESNVIDGSGLTFVSGGDGTCSVTGIGSFSGTELIIPSVSPAGNRVTKIGEEAFANCGGLRSVVIPEGVTEIEPYAFNNCRDLTSITLPDGLRIIGNEAFAQCRKLENVSIPASVTNIGFFAFYDCLNSENIVISKNVKSMYQGVFSGSNSFGRIKTITVEKENPVYYSSGNCIIETKTGKLVQGCAYSVIPDGVKIIDIDSFTFCKGLEKINIPASVTTVVAGAFGHCDNLAEVDYAGTKAQWKKISIDHDNDCLTNAVIKCSDGVMNASDASEGLAFTSNGDGTCFVSGIGSCTDTDIVIPFVSSDGDKVTEIGYMAFCDCTSITSIIIPNGVTSIGSNAFDSCKALKTVTFSDKVTAVGKGAFKGCLTLNDVYYVGTEKTWKTIMIRQDNDPLDNAVIHYTK